jgi:ABC-type Zn uptake system ZnuABC Zn-binding protein ZnuA
MGRAKYLCGMAAVLLALAGCSTRDPWAEVEPGRLKILVSIPPLHSFAANITGQHAEVKCLLTGIGPHDYHPTATDFLKARRADLFLVNGLALDTFITKVVRNAGNRKSLQNLVLAVGDLLPHDTLIHLDEHERKHDHGDGTFCLHGEHDPHVWLGPQEAAAMVKIIADKLDTIDDANRKVYQDNAAAYTAKLKELHEYGLARFKDKKSRTIITTHDSLRYFARGYGLKIAGSIQPRAGHEADAGQLAKLAELCKKEDVRAIMIEPQYSQGTAESLRRHLAGQNVQVQLVEFDPMETANADSTGNPSPDLYLERMKQNIDNLAKALP